MEVSIIRKDVKNINLRVKPNLEVILSAPVELEDRYIDSFLESKREWIEKRLDFFREYQRVENKKEFVSGENFRYLGDNYRLKVVENIRDEVRLENGFLVLYVQNKRDTELKSMLIKNWYKTQAKEIFQKLMAKYQPIVKKDINRVTIKEMKTRWGSCNSQKGYINLNLELIKEPIRCIEYVVAHELAHLVYPNHSREFYNYLSYLLPEWKELKLKLLHKRSFK
jgi:predicted metal-dependent hydrolase